MSWIQRGRVPNPKGNRKQKHHTVPKRYQAERKKEERTHVLLVDPPRHHLIFHRCQFNQSWLGYEMLFYEHLYHLERR